MVADTHTHTHTERTQETGERWRDCTRAMSRLSSVTRALLLLLLLLLSLLSQLLKCRTKRHASAAPRGRIRRRRVGRLLCSRSGTLLRAAHDAPHPHPHLHTCTCALAGGHRVLRMAHKPHLRTEQANRWVSAEQVSAKHSSERAPRAGAYSAHSAGQLARGGRQWHGHRRPSTSLAAARRPSELCTCSSEKTERARGKVQRANQLVPPHSHFKALDRTQQQPFSNHSEDSRKA